MNIAAIKKAAGRLPGDHPARNFILSFPDEVSQGEFSALAKYFDRLSIAG